MPQTFILGAGVTGLAAGVASGLPVYEQTSNPGGICCSYYMRPGSDKRLAEAPADGEVYRFEIGGGHWIFGGDPAVLQFIRSLSPVKTYARKSGVYFPADGTYVPYPLQNHLRFLNADTAAKAIEEMSRPGGGFKTMQEWLAASFGPTLCEKFFNPFHDLYTAGLYGRIAPQDAYKSPVDIQMVKRGAAADAPAVGYNATYIYPEAGLGAVARKMAGRCDVRYGQTAVSIDPAGKSVLFADGSTAKFDGLISTLPLNKAMELAGLKIDEPADPYTSVMVLNIGATRGAKCPEDHWLYVDRSKSGFHRVGFYSNVDSSFLPTSARAKNDRVSIYVERAYAGGDHPIASEIKQYCDSTVEELRAWGLIEKAEVVDPTWVEAAYTWSWPGSKWKPAALRALEEKGIYQVGRYGRWIFQGIADSIRDGFVVGGEFSVGEKVIHRGDAEGAEKCFWVQVNQENFGRQADSSSFSDYRYFGRDGVFLHDIGWDAQADVWGGVLRGVAAASAEGVWR